MEFLSFVFVISEIIIVIDVMSPAHTSNLHLSAYSIVCVFSSRIFASICQTIALYTILSFIFNLSSSI